MKLITFLLCLAIGSVSAKPQCNVPPSLWCSSQEIAERCQVTESCKEYLHPATTAPKVKVSLYYEALCPFSIRFIIGQLAEAKRKVNSIMELELVPFGNAKIKSAGGATRFTCQHGPMECAANLVETCAINLMPRKSFEFINCVSEQILGYRRPPFIAYRVCENEMGVNIKPILSCATSGEGMKYEKIMAKKTNSLKPKKTYVPWILVNGVHTEALNNQAQNDLVGLVCKTYKGSDKPPACNKAYKSATME